MGSMDLRRVFAPSFYASVGVVILTLTGVFNIFANREVIRDVLPLTMIILILMTGGPGYLAAWRARDAGGALQLVAGAVGGLIAGLALALVLVISISIDMRFVFQNLASLNTSALTFGQTVSLGGEGGFEIGGLLLLLAFSLGIGTLAGVLMRLPRRLRDVLLSAAGITIVIGLVVNQINTIIALPDALALALIFTFGYAAALLLAAQLQGRLTLTAALGAGIGLAVGLVIALLAGGGALEDGGLLRGDGMNPVILSLAVTGGLIALLLVMAGAGAVGAVAANGSRLMHNGSLYFVVFLLILGVLNWQENDVMTLTAALLVFAMLAALLYFAPMAGERAEDRFERAGTIDKRTANVVFSLVVITVLVAAPQFMGLYLSNVFNLIALYAVMGLGLNVMIGFTGLLDLGYVASFAIGAYTLGILTAPNLLTCGGVHPNQIPFAELGEVCTGTMTFWQAWPFCVIISALTGMLLGVPVLGLRGDYLAIVTLGFGEIINRLINSNTARPLLGGPQGISPIPTPTIDLSGVNEGLVANLNSSASIYYLFLFSLVLTTFVVARLAKSRVGRAMRAIRADEDVAEAMGVHLIRYKLLAFGVSSAFAGLGGAVFGAQLQGIFPNSFTLLVSINVLSLIIIGGMGSIPGVFFGAIILVGLPELLRELEAYRLLGFGVLLVVVMLVKPEGLLPPQPPRLSDEAKEAQQEVQHGTA